LTLELFRAFRREALEHGSVPVVLLLPNRSDLLQERAGLPRRYGPLLEDLRAEGFRVVELMVAFEGTDAPLDELFAARGHYTAAGNRRVAACLQRVLSDADLLRPAGVAAALASEQARARRAAP
jgi:hypothetical protein